MDINELQSFGRLLKRIEKLPLRNPKKITTGVICRDIDNQNQSLGLIKFEPYSELENHPRKKVKVLKGSLLPEMVLTARLARYDRQNRIASTIINWRSPGGLKEKWLA